MSACTCASPRDGLCGVSQYISCLVFPVGQTTTGRGGGGVSSSRALQLLLARKQSRLHVNL